MSNNIQYKHQIFGINVFGDFYIPFFHGRPIVLDQMLHV